MRLKHVVVALSLVACLSVEPAFAGQDQPIPTVSEWGLVVMTLLGMNAGTIMLGRRRKSRSAP